MSNEFLSKWKLESCSRKPPVKPQSQFLLVQLSPPIWKPFHALSVERLGEKVWPPTLKVSGRSSRSLPTCAWAHISQPSPRVGGAEPHRESRTSCSRADQASPVRRQKSCAISGAFSISKAPLEGSATMFQLVGPEKNSSS